jgi:hypothetical protein
MSPSQEGTPQGGPLSPLLSNILLDELDNVLPSDESEGNHGATGPIDKAKTAQHRLRSIIWRQLKRVYARAKALVRRGLDKERAWRSAKNQRGPWWNAGASHMNQAYPKSY